MNSRLSVSNIVFYPNESIVVSYNLRDIGYKSGSCWIGLMLVIQLIYHIILIYIIINLNQKLKVMIQIIFQWDQKQDKVQYHMYILLILYDVCSFNL